MPLGAEDLVPQALEVVLIPQQILIHLPLNPHLQDGGDEDQEDLRLQVLIQMVAGSLHPALVGLIVLLDVIPVLCEAQHVVGLEAGAPDEGEVPALGEPGPLGLCIVFYGNHLAILVSDEDEVGAIAVVLLP